MKSITWVWDEEMREACIASLENAVAKGADASGVSTRALAKMKRQGLVGKYTLAQIRAIHEAVVAHAQPGEGADIAMHVLDEAFRLADLGVAKAERLKATEGLLEQLRSQQRSELPMRDAARLLA